MFDIITIGSATRDVFLISHALHPHRAPDALTHIEACFPFGAKIGIDEIHFDTGGGAGNNAATFAKLGKFKVAALSAVGDDSEGREIVRVLKEHGVSTELMQTAPRAHTAYSTILSPGGEVGERTILVYRGASERFDHKKIPWQKLQARWFYVSSLGGDLALLKKILTHAKQTGAQVAFNPGGQELSTLSSLSKRSASKGLRQAQAILGGVTFLILNREESSRLTGVKFEDTKGLLRALARLTRGALMTDGNKGAYAVISSRESVHGSHQHGKSKTKSYVLRPTYSAYYVPSVGHKPKNITGAGDAFGSGFVTGWIKSRGDIKYALRLASFNADSVVQHIGAKVGILEKIPSKRQMQKLSVREIKL